MAILRPGARFAIFLFLVGIRATVADEESNLKSISNKYAHVDLTALADALKRAREWIVKEEEAIFAKTMGPEAARQGMPSDAKQATAQMSKTIKQLEDVLRSDKKCHKDGADMTVSKILNLNSTEALRAMMPPGMHGKAPTGMNPEEFRNLMMNPKTRQKLSQAEYDRLHPKTPVKKQQKGPNEGNDHPSGKEHELMPPEAFQEMKNEYQPTKVLFQNVTYEGVKCSPQQMWTAIPLNLSNMVPVKESRPSHMFIGGRQKLTCGKNVFEPSLEFILSFKDIIHSLSLVATLGKVDIKEDVKTGGRVMVTASGFGEQGPKEKFDEKGNSVHYALIRQLSRQLSGEGLEEKAMSIGKSGLPKDFSLCLYSDSKSLDDVKVRVTAYLNKFITTMQEELTKKGEIDWSSSLNRAVVQSTAVADKESAAKVNATKKVLIDKTAADEKAKADTDDKENAENEATADAKKEAADKAAAEKAAAQKAAADKLATEKAFADKAAADKSAAEKAVDSVATELACFPFDATVELQCGTMLEMGDLRIGDIVKTGMDEYSPVFMFTHQSIEIESKFILLTTGSGHSISTSFGHKIYANSDLISASEVSVGDMLSLGNGLTSPVVMKDVKVKRGLYNPQTSGNIVVNGIVASTYTTALEPVVAHALLSPIRAIGDLLSFA